MKPSSEIIEIVKLIDSGITIFLNNANEIKIGKYESIVECRLILNLCIRHIESINELAKLDMVYLPSAMVLTRTVFESAINALWLIQPEDVFKCESRYLSRLYKYEKWLNDQMKYFDSLNWSSIKYAEEKESIVEFRTGFEKQLLIKGYQISNSKNFRQTLISLNEERKYLYYKLLSGFTHGSYYSTNMYRRNLGTSMILGEFINIDEWKFIYNVAWPVFEIASESYIYRASMGKICTIYSDEFKDEIRRRINITTHQNKS